MRKTIYALAAVLALAACSGTGNSPKASKAALDELSAGWENPPQSARTRVWWHWMNGNITKEGILHDIQWFKQIGLGGFQTFDAAMNSPVVVENRLVYMTDGWKDAFRYAMKVADSLGLEVAIASSPGWSSTGGPWVEPQDAMKKLVWRTAVYDGGKTIEGTLPPAFTSTGTFQNLGSAQGSVTTSMFAPGSKQYYEDVAVIAVKMPEGRKSASDLGAKVSASAGAPTLQMLTDEDIVNGFELPADQKTGYSWIKYEFPQAATIYGVRYSGGSSLYLEKSDDGVNFTKVCDLDASEGVSQTTVTIPATTAKFFRVIYPNPQPRSSYYGVSAAPRSTKVTELELLPYSRVNHAEEKAAFSEAAGHFPAVATPSTGESFPSVSEVIDITANVKDGKISWNAPEGKWKIYRFGYSLTGKQNHPAPAEATGLEVDKLDQKAWTRFFHNYLDMYKEASAGMVGQHGVQYVLTDSYEAGIMTWTPAMFEEFSARRGYDLKTWLPALAGEIISSPEETDRFLFDWRKTISDLFTASYELLSDIAIKEYGMKGRYTESHENGRVYAGDGMDIKKTAQVPMSAMWVNAPWIAYDVDSKGNFQRSMYKADDKESSSVAHIYGQNVAAAESMTAAGGAYTFFPYNLKEVADMEMASGINRFVIHESAHQPSDVLVPGLSLSGIGQWFNRHDTWAPMAGTWVDYMSRSCFMLQAGKNVADILYYFGEDTNITYEFGYAQSAPKIPAGYQWDYCGEHALLNQIDFKNGVLTSKSGTQYKVIWMDRNMERVSVPVLKKLAALANAGAWIGGMKPQAPASLSDNIDEFNSLVADIFGSGRANVMETASISDFLAKAGVPQDVKIDASYNFLHRTMKGAEIYWINKPLFEGNTTVTLSFHTVGLKPSVWHPDTGKKEAVSYRQNGEWTDVDLNIVPNDAFFVVFAGKALDSETVPAKAEKVTAQLAGPWKIKFQEQRGAPAETVFTDLHSFTEEEEFGIKYFSGISTYSNTVNLPKAAGETYLDLGDVKFMAEVWVNGQYCGRAWKQPYRVDISSAVKEGDNAIEVKVANSWVNRLVGDLQPEAKEKITYTDAPRAFTPTMDILPAGLLGPVKVLSME
ncbi:MAG: glycoside hydrolase family 2 [Bacteroidales bacterium]|nr:glycoside hydrolase family 2 [Bacteroidales bacterium]